MADRNYRLIPAALAVIAGTCLGCGGSQEGGSSNPVGGDVVGFDTFFGKGDGGTGALDVVPVEDGKVLPDVASDLCATVSCDPKSPCQVGKCDSATGTCKFADKPDGSACDAGDPCVVNGACVLGQCVGKPNPCDDANPCTADACTKEKGCVHQFNADTCDDGSSCTKDDHCKNGACQGSPIPCDDGETCTSDSCDPVKGCQHVAITGPCDDGNPCTSGDWCASGKCGSGTNTCACSANGDCASKDDGDLCNGTLFCDKSTLPWVCKVNPATIVTCPKSDDPCTSSSCDAGLGTCKVKKKVDGDWCAVEGDVCTSKHACLDGVCTPPKPALCDDTNACTSDTCDPKAGCKHAPIEGLPCDADGSACTVGDACSGGECKAGSAKTCDDANPCTLDACDPATGVCSHDKGALDGLACNGGSGLCSTGDSCKSGVCVPGKVVSCDDANPCTDDACDPKTGCTHINNTVPCDADSNACTVGDACESGVCKAGTAKTCDDSNACTLDACDPTTGACSHDKAAMEGVSCNAGSNSCTSGDACKAGVCTAGVAIGCDDKNPCTDDVCDPKVGCVHTNNTLPCDADGNACTVGDACEGGACKAGPAKNCDDQNPCTKDSCDPKTGACDFASAPMEGKACDADGNPCTPGDACAAGFCKAGAPAAVGTPCDDGKACTDGDACSAESVCVGKPKICDDGKPCTIDACDESAKGCVFKSAPSGAPCDDGKFCTFGEACDDKGVCGGGKPVDCAANACSTGTCDEVQKKCVGGSAMPDGSPCNADDNGCTKDDVCYGGKCFAGGPVNCFLPKDYCNTWTCKSTGATTYQCASTPAAAGAPCDDNLFCTVGESCDGSGTCKGGVPKDCAAAGASCNAGVCDEGKKACVAKAKADGAACDDGDPCTLQDTCKGGLCLGSAVGCLEDGDTTVSVKMPWRKSDLLTNINIQNDCGNNKLTGYGSFVGGPAIVATGMSSAMVAWPSLPSVVGNLVSKQGHRSIGESKLTIYVGNGVYDGVGMDMFLDSATVTDGKIALLLTSNVHAYTSKTSIGTVTATSEIRVFKPDLQGFEPIQKADLAKGNVTVQAGSCSPTYCTSSFANPELRQALVASRSAGDLIFSLTNKCKGPIAHTGAVLNWYNLGYTSSGNGLPWATGWTALVDDPAALPRSIGVLADDAVVAIWNAGAGLLKGQRFSAQNQKDGVEFQVNDSADPSVANPMLYGLPNGRMLVTWENGSEGGDLRAQLFKSEPGVKFGSAFNPAQTTAGWQGNARVGVFSDSSFVVVWEDQAGRDGDGKGILARWFSAAGLPLTDERIVNLVRAGDQILPNVTVMKPDDVAVVVWVNAADGEVYRRMFGKLGAPDLGIPEFRANTTTKGAQSDAAGAAPRVTNLSLGDGSYVLAWSSDGQDGSGKAVVARRYGVTGSPAGGEFVVNTYTNGDQLRPDVGADQAGNFVVVWESVGQDGDLEGVYGQRYMNTGAKNGAEFPLHTVTVNEQTRPRVAVQPSGAFAVAWETYASPGGASYDAALRCFDKDAKPAGPELLVNAVVPDKQMRPDIASFPDGSGTYAVVWQSYNQVGATSAWDVYLRLYTANCVPMTDAILVNQVTSDEQSEPAVAVSLEGQIGVAWQSKGQDGSGFGIYLRRFDPTGKPLGAESKVNRATESDQTLPSASYLPNGNLVVAWQTLGEDEEGFAIKSVEYDSKGVETGVEWFASRTTAKDQWGPRVIGRANGTWITAWTSEGQDGDLGTVIGRLSNNGECLTDKDCEDNNPCTTNSCAAGKCKSANNTNPCASDGDPCTTGDTCMNGQCKGTPISCNDNNVCTDDSCDHNTGKCVNAGIPWCNGGCYYSDAAGCGGCQCESAVCAEMPSCCQKNWGSLCVQLCNQKYGGCDKGW